MSADEVSTSTRKRGPMRFGSRLLLILVILSVVTIISVWVFDPPMYRVSSTVYVESPLPRMPMQIADPPVPLELMDRYVDDQVVLFKDEQVLTETLKSAAVMETKWYKSHPDKGVLLNDLKNTLSVRRIPKTNYLKVSFATKNPNDCPAVVNTVITKYLAKVESSSHIKYAEELKDATTEENRLSDELEVIRNKKRECLNNEMGLVGITEGENIVRGTWRALAEEVTRLEAEKLQQKAAYENLTGVDPSKIAISPEMRTIVEQDPQIINLRDKRLDLELQLHELQSKAEGDKGDLPAVQAKIKMLDEKLLELRAQREKEVREYQLNVAKTRYLNAMQAELQLSDRMLEAENKQQDLNLALAEYRQLEEDQMLLEHQLTQLRDHINLLKMVIKDRGMVRVRQVSLAVPPTKLDSSRQVRLTAVAAAVPLVFAVLLFLVRGIKSHH